MATTGIATIELLKERLSGKRNPNGVSFCWSGETLPCGTTWATGFEDYDIIPFEWGFQLIKDNGMIAPPTQINFGKFASEVDFNGAFNRAVAFLKGNCERTQALPAYIWGD